MISNSKNEEKSLQIKDLKTMVNQLLNRVDGLEKRLVKAEEENLKLIDANIELATDLDNISTKYSEIERKLKVSEKKVVKLEKESQALINKLHRKNSRNSSIPPSKDENRPPKNYSLREKSGKKVGGQKGHKGTTLKFSDNPTQVINHLPNLCDNCGHQLVSEVKLVQRKQIIDIPPIVPHIIEHRTFSQTCSCGHCSVGQFPKGIKNIKNPISYGSGIEALISYFSVRQFIPIKRIEEMLAQVFGLNITASTICNKLAKTSDKLLPLYSWIHRQISKSPVVGCDETGCRVNGNKGWIWTWQNDHFTYLAYSPNRGEQTIKDHFPNGLPNSILVHDCYKAQFKVNCKGHQLCTAHLLRELNFFIEQGDQWSIKFKKQIKQALNLLKKIKANPNKNFRRAINKIYKAVELLLIGSKKHKGKLESFKDRMRKRRKSLFRFLEDPSIPPDNNGSERAIRNVKVKTKVSGMFKTDLGADQFAVIRSVIDTFIKRRQPILKSLIKAVS